MIFRTVHNRENPYFQLNRAAVNDERLSYKAIGIHAYLMSKPDNWEANEADIISRHTEGREAVRSGVKELLDLGYMHRSRIIDEHGKVIKWVLDVYESPELNPHTYPQSGFQIVDKPQSGFPEVEKPHCGFPTRSKYIYSETERKESKPELEVAPKTNGAPPSSPNDYLPGLPDPRAKTSQRTRVVEYVMEAKKLGVEATEFRLLVDALLDGFGKKLLADAGDEKTLNYAQELALIVMGVSEQFRTPDGIAAIFKSWQANDWRGDSLPTSEQLKEHASLMASGKVTCTRKDKLPPPAKPTKLNYKSWLLRTYNADNPTFIGVPKAELEKGYNDYVKQFQLQH